MGALALICNVVWLICGGLWMAFGWFLAAILMFLSILGIPFGFAALSMARYALLPFGHTTIEVDSLGNTPIGTLANILWLVLGGWWLALLHFLHAVALAITIVGLPFAWAHLKLAGLALWPLGRDVVSTDSLLWRR